MRKKFAISVVSASLFGFAVIQGANAQTLLVAPTALESGEDLIEVIENLTNWLFFGFLLLASIFIILAAFQFVTKGGDPAQVSEAKKKLIFAVVAVIIATLAKGFVTVAISILGI